MAAGRVRVLSDAKTLTPTLSQREKSLVGNAVGAFPYYVYKAGTVTFNPAA